MAGIIITQERLKELFHYDPLTGFFKRLIQTGSTALAGQNAGTPLANKYLRIRIDGIAYLSHRLAFLYMTGEFPKDQVDHINHDRINNSWANLREATASDNHKNYSQRADNTSGATGVYWAKSNKKWTSMININGKRTRLGYFPTFQDAICARKRAEIEYGYHPNHGLPAES